MKRILSLVVATCASCVLGQAEAPLKDKTLVAWVSPANLTQKGGSALTIDDNKTHFDGIVFGELSAAKWMAGSDGWTRSQRDQSASPAETADAKASVQMAIVYRGKQIALYRDGKEYARYEVGEPLAFGKDSTVLMGLRHLLAGDRAGFAGAIDDARIYAVALSVEQLASLKVNEPSDPKPLAWWNFQNGKPEDAMGAYPPAALVGSARIEGGKLILDGNGSSMVTPPAAAPPPPPAYVAPYDSPIHFRPDRGVLADTIPFYWKGEYHVFYLRGGVGKVPWEHIVSKDLVNWKELPTALVSDGAADGPDGEHMFTGSVTEKDGTFHIFYTGWNPRNAGGREFIMHATSPDLITWTKRPEDRLGPDGVIYKNHQDRDWRDAYVFWNADEQRHWMVMCSNSSKPEEGGVGLLTSKDLKTWTCEPPLKGADQQECPDLFKIGETWHLIGGDHYSFAKNARGPYQKPPVCNFIDRPGVYAAKRMFDGKRHIWTGWVWDIPTGRDGEPGTWGGTQSLPREIYAGPDGQLYSRPVEEVVAVFKKTVFQHKGISVDKGSAFDVPDNYMVECQVQMEPGAELTIAMRQQPQGDAYRFVIAPGKKEASLRGPGFDYRRPCPVDASKPVKFQAFVQGTIIECFVNDQYAQTCRAYNFRKGKLAFEVLGGAAKLLSLAVKTHDEEEGFKSLFDGKTLDGWKAADMSFWSVEDGAITAKITPEHPLKSNLYLIWQGGELADFELKMKHRVFGSPNINCGFQFRSFELPNHDVKGYQMDNNLNTDWLARLYDEHGRDTLAWRGEHTVFDVNGQATKQPLTEAQGPADFKLEEWHEIDLLCIGPSLTLKINGKLAAAVLDLDPKQQDLQGILGLQLHTGPTTVAQFKDIRLKVLKPAAAR